MTESLGDLEFGFKGNFKALEYAEACLAKIEAKMTAIRNINLSNSSGEQFVSTLRRIEQAANSAASAVARLMGMSGGGGGGGGGQRLLSHDGGMGGIPRVVSSSVVYPNALPPGGGGGSGGYGGGMTPNANGYNGGDWEPKWNFTPKQSGGGGPLVSRFATRMLMVSMMEAAAASQRRDIMLAEGDQMSDVGAQLGQTRQMIEGENTGFGFRAVGSWLSDHVKLPTTKGTQTLTSILTGYNTTAEGVGEMVRLEQMNKKEEGQVKARQQYQANLRDLGLLEDHEGYEGISGKLGDYRRSSRLAGINPNDKDAVQLQQLADARDKQIEAIKLEADALRKAAVKAGMSTAAADKYEKDASYLVGQEFAGRSNSVNRASMVQRISRSSQARALGLAAVGQGGAAFFANIDAERTAAMSMSEEDAAFANAQIDAKVKGHNFMLGQRHEDYQDFVAARKFHLAGDDASSKMVGLYRKAQREAAMFPELSGDIDSQMRMESADLKREQDFKKTYQFNMLSASIQRSRLLADPLTSLSASIPPMLAEIEGSMFGEKDMDMRRMLGREGIGRLQALESQTLNAGFFGGGVHQISGSRTDFSGTNASDAQRQTDELLKAIKDAIGRVEDAIRNSGPAAS